MIKIKQNELENNEKQLNKWYDDYWEKYNKETLKDTSKQKHDIKQLESDIRDLNATLIAWSSRLRRQQAINAYIKMPLENRGKYDVNKLFGGKEEFLQAVVNEAVSLLNQDTRLAEVHNFLCDKSPLKSAELTRFSGEKTFWQNVLDQFQAASAYNGLTHEMKGKVLKLLAKLLSEPVSDGTFERALAKLGGKNVLKAIVDAILNKMDKPFKSDSGEFLDWLGSKSFDMELKMVLLNHFHIARRKVF
jgi:hypothetical protein